MTSKPKADISDILMSTDRLIREAYQRGYLAGSAATLSKIMKAAQAVQEPAEEIAPIAAKEVIPVQSNPVDTDAGESPPSRVERGTVRRVLHAVMSSMHGITMSEARNRALKIDARISPTSIPNELMRNKETLYRQEGDLWFLIGDADRERAGSASNEHPAQSASINGGPRMDPP